MLEQRGKDVLMTTPLGQRHLGDAGELIVTCREAAVTPVVADQTEERAIFCGREMGRAPVIVSKME